MGGKEGAPLSQLYLALLPPLLQQAELAQQHPPLRRSSEARAGQESCCESGSLERPQARVFSPSHLPPPLPEPRATPGFERQSPWS